MARLFFGLIVILFCTSHLYGEDEVVWNGNVNADGEPTEIIKLTLGKKYRIKVDGTINLGKWKQQGKPLASDACYEYAAGIEPTKILNFKNSMNISVCEGNFHENHIYESEPFTAAQSGIHFWVQDSNYDDNSGAFRAYVIELRD